MVYHMVMPRKQVLVQLDDALVDALDRLAERHGVSRSELIRRGAAAVIESAERLEADRAVAEAYRATPETEAEIAAAHATALRLLDEETW